MANNLITSQLVSDTALSEFAVNAPFIQTSDRTYQYDFTQAAYKPGDTVNVRRQNRFITGDGAVAIDQDILEDVEPITISHQYNAKIVYTMQDLTLRIEDFNRIFIRPAIQSIIAKLETDLAAAAATQLYYYVGTPGTPINSFGSVDDAGVKLLEQAVNLSDNAYFALSNRDASQAKRGLLGSFTPMLNEDITRQSSLGHISYFDMFQSQNMFRLNGGTATTTYSADVLTVNGAVATGNTIVLAGANGAAGANYFVPGDSITISGVYNINPLNYNPTQLAQFVITAPATAVAGAVTIQVAPSIISDPTNPRRNVSGVIPNGATVSRVLTTTKPFVNVAYAPRALSLVCPPLGKLQVPFSSVSNDPETGLSLAVCQDGNIDTYQNKMRIDLLCGFKWHPEYAIKYFT